MSTSQTIPLVIASGERVYDKIKALVDGTVRIEDCSLSFVPLASGEMLVRAFEDAGFNVAELSLSNYVTRRAQGNCPYVAVPVYIARSFRHADLYVRSDRVLKPEDLRGTRVGIAEYEHTLYVWARGILEDEYNVRPSDVEWISVSKHAPGPSDDNAFQPPSGVSIEHLYSAKTLSEMLESGEIDALISVQAPPCFTSGALNIARLFPNHRAVEDDYFRRTGIFPILHIMGIRNELVARNPGLPRNVFKAFLMAKNLALAAEMKVAPLPSADATIAANVSRMTALMGKDYYSYGLNERDRATLSLFLDYHFRQGLSQRRHDIAELFAPVPMADYQV